MPSQPDRLSLPETLLFAAIACVALAFAAHIVAPVISGYSLTLRAVDQRCVMPTHAPVNALSANPFAQGRP